MPRIKQIAKKKTCTKARFASLDAEVRFQELYHEKQYLPDLGFVLDVEHPYPLPTSCRDTIRTLGWERFCEQRIEPDISVVREFYSNLWPNNVYSVFVREQHVSLSPQAINNLFNLPNFSNDTDDFYTLLLNLDDEVCDQLFKDITVPGAQWTTSKQGNKTCRREHLTDEAKVWFYFLRHSLMPTGHTTTLTVDRVVLLACIVKSRPINVGKIISEQLRICANRKSGEMFFPTLICLLCRAAGVEVEIDDSDIYPQGTVSAYDLARIIPIAPIQSTPGPSQTPAEPPSAPPTAAAPAPSAEPVPAPQLEDFMKQQRLFWQYVHARDAAYVRSLPRQRQQAGAPWPTFPSELLPNQPVDDTEPEIQFL